MSQTTSTDPRPILDHSPVEVPDVPTHEDPHDRLTAKQEARFAAYMAEPKSLPASGVDRATGHALPMSRQEAKARMEHLMTTLAAIDAEDDDPPGSWERMAREINEERALEGRGPAFSEKDLCGG